MNRDYFTRCTAPFISRHCDATLYLSAEQNRIRSLQEPKNGVSFYRGLRYPDGNDKREEAINVWQGKGVRAIFLLHGSLSYGGR